MEAVMKSWTKKTSIDVTIAARVVRRIVQIRRALGAKQPEAFEQTADILGTSARRVRSIYRGEVFTVPIEEYGAYVSREWADYRTMRAELQEMAERLGGEAEREWAEQHQLSFDLSAPTSRSSKPGGVFGTRGER